MTDIMCNFPRDPDDSCQAHLVKVQLSFMKTMSISLKVLTGWGGNELDICRLSSDCKLQ